jgi:hypothetical protein
MSDDLLEKYQLSGYDVKVLQVLRGDEVSDVIYGAALMMTVSSLRSRGLAVIEQFTEKNGLLKSRYVLTNLGANVLAELTRTEGV